MPRLRPPPPPAPAIEPERLPAADLLAADVPDSQAILAPLLRSLNLLYGPRGMGKTFVALAIARAAAAGDRFLGWQAARRHRVLYIDGEMAAADVRNRLAALGPAPDTLEFILADLRANGLPDLASEAGQAAIGSACTPPPDLLVLDNLSSLAGFRTADADPWPKLQPFLLRLRRQTAVLVLHHTNKRGVLRGSAQHEDVLDLVLALRRPAAYAPRQGARFELHVEKARALAGRALDPVEAQLRFDAEGRASWAWWPIEQQDVHRVAALLRDGLNPNQISRALGISKSKAYRLREQVVASPLT